MCKIMSTSNRMIIMIPLKLEAHMLLIMLIKQAFEITVSLLYVVRLAFTDLFIDKAAIFISRELHVSFYVGGNCREI